MIAAAGKQRSPTSVLTCCLALFLLCNSFALNSFLEVASPASYKETVLDHTSDVLHGQGCDDSWGSMALALSYALSPHTTPVYSEIFFNRKLKFQYPLTSLFAIAFMQWAAGPEHVRLVECQDFDAPTINDILGWAFLLMTAVSAAMLLEIELKRRYGTIDSFTLMAARALVVFGLTLTFYPLVKAYTLGQIQVWINGLFALALLCWVTGRRVGSGVLIGIACLVKPHFGVFLLWAALRSEWRFAAACAATGSVGLLASIAVFGWTDNIEYLTVLKFLSEHGETFYPNQSVNGLLLRLMSLSDPVSYNVLTFDDHSFPPYNAWVYAGVVTTSLLLLAAALFRRGSDGDPGRKLDFCIMALSAAMASPIAWEHHYGVVFPMFAVALVGSIGNRMRLIGLTASYVLISNYVHVAQLLAPTIWNVAQSYLFFGAFILLVLLHSARPGWQFARATLAPGAGRQVSFRDRACSFN